MTSKNPNAWYGFQRDQRDPRDHLFSPKKKALPDGIDLRSNCPPIMDQGQLGSCTAHGITGALRYELIKSRNPDVPLSRLFLYFNERAMEGTIASDAGAQIRDGIKSAGKVGVCAETLWPYKIKKFATKPPAKCNKAAVQFAALSYARVQVDADALKAALVAGHTPVIGITVFEEFESDAVAKTGMVPMPTSSSKPIGGHCLFVCGYDQRGFIVQNSWGADWGDQGFCHIPFAYLGSPKFGSDYWVIGSEGAIQSTKPAA